MLNKRVNQRRKLIQNLPDDGDEELKMSNGIEETKDQPKLNQFGEPLNDPEFELVAEPKEPAKLTIDDLAWLWNEHGVTAGQVMTLPGYEDFEIAPFIESDDSDYVQTHLQEEEEKQLQRQEIIQKLNYRNN